MSALFISRFTEPFWASECLLVATNAAGSMTRPTPAPVREADIGVASKHPRNLAASKRPGRPLFGDLRMLWLRPVLFDGRGAY